MSKPHTIAERFTMAAAGLGPAELRVAEYLRDNRENAIANSAAILAEAIGTSDATVIRTVKELGYGGMSELRRDLADEIRNDLSPASRLERTLRAAEAEGALAVTLRVQEQSLQQLRTDIPQDLFEGVVGSIAHARRVWIFGIGPSKPLADYFRVQLQRIGIDSSGLTDSGIQLADGLLGTSKGDAVILLAFGPAYREALAVQKHARAAGARVILVSDGEDRRFVRGSDVFLRVQRGRSGEFSMHVPTLALLEALLVGVAAVRPVRTMDTLKKLKALRHLVQDSAPRPFDKDRG